MTNTISEPDAPAMPTKRSRQSGRIRIITAVAIAVGISAAAYGWHWWNNGRFMENTEDAYVGGDITVISSKVPGYILSAAVTDNQAVHAGDLLVKLDDRDYRAALEKAEGAVAAQQALLANLDATRNLQQAVIAQAKAGVVATVAETSRSRDDEQRYQNLSAKAAVSVQSAQRADADYKQALANGQKAQAVQVAAQRELDVIATRRQQAAAALTQVIAERDIAKLNLDYTELRAPIDGVIGNRYARNGAYAAAGAHMMSIVPARGLWIDANFKESQLARLRPGLPATIEADVLPGRQFHGHVASMAPATGAQFSVLPPENATGNFTKIVQRVPVRIVLDDADGVLGTLRPGLSVIAEIDARSTRSRQQ
ncbi:MAG: Membrane fusion component of tripartite multidrug resistance system [Herbaspirillum sp.]|nr:Membrane fusion component of tripartite multidrug resistance system [Herbaspirillum sp.]